MIYLLTAVICSGFLILLTALSGSVVVGVIGSIAFFVLGIPSAILIHQLEKKFWGHRMQVERTAITIVIYAVAGMVTMFILLAFMSEGNIFEHLDQLLPFMFIGMISSLSYYMVLSILRMILNRRNAQ